MNSSNGVECVALLVPLLFLSITHSSSLICGSSEIHTCLFILRSLKSINHAESVFLVSFTTAAAPRTHLNGGKEEVQVNKAPNSITFIWFPQWAWDGIIQMGFPWIRNWEACPRSRTLPLCSLRLPSMDKCRVVSKALNQDLSYMKLCKGS